MREDLIKAYDEMVATQEKFLRTKLDEDLIRAREAERHFHDVAWNVPWLPFPQNDGELERERQRKDEIILDAMPRMRRRCESRLDELASNARRLLKNR